MEKDIQKIIVINKQEGETPLEALEKFRRLNKEYKDIKMTYAGRLDPMARGLLLVLCGEEVKNKEKYLVLSKEYEFEVLFGFATDTYDILGKVTSTKKYLGTREELEKLIKGNLKYFTGKFLQAYPPYSSKAVKGKALFEYARRGIEVERPEREVSVTKLTFLGLKKISSEKLLLNIEKRIKKVKGPARNAKGIPASNALHSDAGWAFAGGDFRQEKILKIWDKKLNTMLQKKPHHFFIGSFKITCSSGTYVRGIANILGEKIALPTLAFSIRRTKIGKWKLRE